MPSVCMIARLLAICASAIQDMKGMDRSAGKQVNCNVYHKGGVEQTWSLGIIHIEGEVYDDIACVRFRSVNVGVPLMALQRVSQ